MQRKNEQSIGEILRQYLKMSQLENRVFESQLSQIWHETLGASIAAQTDRIHLEAGVLYVMLKSPSLKYDIMMQRTSIKTLLNQKLGSDIIKNVIVR